MGFLRSFRAFDAPKVLVGEKHVLRLPEIDDYVAWRLLRLESRSFLEPWEPTWNDDDLTLGSFRQRLRRNRHMVKEDLAYPYFVFDTAGTLLGSITVSNIRRGIAQMGTLGYWIGEKFSRQGHMTAALQMVIEHGFGDLGLHRVEAACLPRNVASIRLLQRCGFDREGLAREYLKIDGRWEDHVLFGKVRS